MAVKTMSRVATQDERDEIAWEYTDTLTAPGNGDSVMMPTGVTFITAMFIPTAGSGKLEATTDTQAEVIAGTATWLEWGWGVMTETEMAFCIPVTAIRQVNVGGTTKMTIRAQ